MRRNERREWIETIISRRAKMLDRLELIADNPASTQDQVLRAATMHLQNSKADLVTLTRLDARTHRRRRKVAK